jgi:hypothetical protein
MCYSEVIYGVDCGFVFGVMLALRQSGMKFWCLYVKVVLQSTAVYFVRAGEKSFSTTASYSIMPTHSSSLT